MVLFVGLYSLESRVFRDVWLDERHVVGRLFALHQPHQPLHSTHRLPRLLGNLRVSLRCRSRLQGQASSRGADFSPPSSLSSFPDPKPSFFLSFSFFLFSPVFFSPSSFSLSGRSFVFACASQAVRAYLQHLRVRVATRHVFPSRRGWELLSVSFPFCV